jgi:hypothetical protein
MLDREEALRDDFQLETTYDYGEEDEWDDNEGDWAVEEEGNNEEETLESKDESKAYLEFLNDEVRGKLYTPTLLPPCVLHTNIYPCCRLRNIAVRLKTSTMTSWERTVSSWTLPSTKLNPTSCSRALFSVSLSLCAAA